MAKKIAKNTNEFEEIKDPSISDDDETSVFAAFSPFHGKIQNALGGMAFVFVILNLDPGFNDILTALALSADHIQWAADYESYTWSADGKERKTVKIGGKAKSKAKGIGMKMYQSIKIDNMEGTNVTLRIDPLQGRTPRNIGYVIPKVSKSKMQLFQKFIHKTLIQYYFLG